MKFHQVVELNKEREKNPRTTKQTQNTIREGVPQMDKISRSLSMMYAAFKLLSSSLEQEYKD